MGLKEQIAAAARPPLEEVSINGVEFYVRGLTIAEQFELSEMEDGADVTYWFLAHAICDKNGVSLFDADDEMLRGFALERVNELSAVARRLTGLEEQAKN